MSPRENSSNWSTGDQVTGSRLQDFNEDIDDIYANGDDRLRVVEAVSGTALKIDIGAGARRVGEIHGTYAGGTDILVTDDATNYIMIDNVGAIQQSTVAWNASYARLAIVTASSGKITNVALHRPDTFGGDLQDPDINGKSAKTTLVEADELLVSDSEDSNNLKKVTMSNLGLSLIPFLFGDGSDGALTVSSGTTNINLDTVYNYSSISISGGAILSSTDTSGIMKLKCLGICTIDGTIDLDGLILGELENITSELLNISVSAGTDATGGAGGAGSATNTPAATAGIGGTVSDKYGGGGGGGAGDDANGGAGGVGGTPGGTGGAGGLASSQADHDGSVGGNSSGGGGGGYNVAEPDLQAGGDGGDAYGNNGDNGGQYNNYGGGGGGAGGDGGGGGASLMLFAKTFTGSGTITSDGGNGLNGGDGGDGGSTHGGAGGGGGAGAGAGGGAHLLIGYTNSFGGTTGRTAGSNGSAGSKGSEGGNSDSDGSAGSAATGSATVGNIINSQLNDIM